MPLHELSTVSIFLLLLFWRLRNLSVLWLLILSVFTFSLAILSHVRSPVRRSKGRAKPGVKSAGSL